jgi:hypothetical protein
VVGAGHLFIQKLASRIVVQQEEGETRDRERSSMASGLGFTRTRKEESRSGAESEAEFPGSPKGAQKTSLKVTYTTDYGIDTRIVKTGRIWGVNLGGKFQQQRDTIWRLDAEFPSLAD